MKFIWDRAARGGRGDWIDAEVFFGRGGPAAASDLARPNVQGDLPAYQSPLSFGETPRMIEGRAARREELRRNGLEEAAPGDKWRFNGKPTNPVKLDIPVATDIDI